MAFDYITGTRFLVSFEGIDTASTFLYSVVSIYVFMAFSTIFHFINSPDNSPFSHSILTVLSLSYSVVLSTIHLCMKVSFSPDIIPSSDWAQNTN